MKLGCEEIEVRRISLVEDQVIAWKLPPAPTKVTDSRSANWDGLGQVELDAVKPEKLIELLDDAVSDIFDEEFIANVRAHGVSNEQYLAAAYNLKSGHLMQDMGNATRMLKRRMVGVAMHNTEGRSDVAALIDRALAADEARRAKAANSQGEGGEA